ncbi:MAG TPA: LysR family transcriptional regulator [Syntrophomonadaceae bacterium]|nr:LysR family transcriptional regulator [Syntrophomonadaceae bacterium]HQE23149.1 LysR family transcriptional regulator [Syntrophomonadaceae bacterium]
MYNQDFIVFKAVAETKNITLAAKQLHISQPAVSLQIQNIENYYGTKFFERSNRGVTLTKAGIIFYDYVCKMLEMTKNVQEELNELVEDHHEEVKIGATLTIGEYILPNILAYLYKMRPDIDFKVTIANTENITRDILERKYRIGLVEGPVPQSKDLEIENFWHDELVVVVPYHHPWAQKGSVTLNDLRKAKMILREVGSGTRSIFELFLAEKGLALSDLNITMELGSTQSIKQVVAAGLGVTVISALTVRKECEEEILKAVKIQDCYMGRPLNILTNANNAKTKAERFLIDFLHNKELLEKVVNNEC